VASIEVCLARETKPLLSRERKEFFYFGGKYLKALAETATTVAQSLEKILYLTGLFYSD
jgi:hypothetical protein